MRIELVKATEEDLGLILKLQKKAFEDLLLKYEDYDTNPGNESIEDIKRRFNCICQLKYGPVNGLILGQLFIP